MPPPGDRLNRLLGLVRARGLRMTLARRALLEQLISSDTHLTADELTDRVCAAAGQVHRATIYRCLDALEDAGVVEHVHLGHGRAVYHLVDDLHHHLVCESCGAVAQAPGGLLDGVERLLQKTHGFRMRPYHFAVMGLCRNCEARPGAAVTELPAG